MLIKYFKFLEISIALLDILLLLSVFHYQALPLPLDLHLCQSLIFDLLNFHVECLLFFLQLSFQPFLLILAPYFELFRLFLPLIFFVLALFALLSLHSLILLHSILAFVNLL